MFKTSYYKMLCSVWCGPIEGDLVSSSVLMHKCVWVCVRCHQVTQHPLGMEHYGRVNPLDNKFNL